MVHQDRIFGQQKHGCRRIDPSREGQTDLLTPCPCGRPTLEKIVMPRREKRLRRDHQQVRMEANRSRVKRQFPVNYAFFTPEGQPLSSCLP